MGLWLYSGLDTQEAPAGELCVSVVEKVKSAWDHISVLEPSLGLRTFSEVAGQRGIWQPLCEAIGAKRVPSTKQERGPVFTLKWQRLGEPDRGVRPRIFGRTSGRQRPALTPLVGSVGGVVVSKNLSSPSFCVFYTMGARVTSHLAWRPCTNYLG